MAIKTKKKEATADRIALQEGILNRLAYSDTSLGVSELGREFSKPKMYVHRLLSSLESIGWVSKDQISQKYKVGNELFKFALLLASRFSLSKITLPYLYELADITNETTALCVRIGYERLFVQEILGNNAKRLSVILGQRSPLWLGPAGKSMAAFLSDTEMDELVGIMRRERPVFRGGLPFNTDQFYQDFKEIKKVGYAIGVGEYRSDVVVLAAPIFDESHTVIGSLIVRGKLPHFNLEAAKQHSAVILEMANKITREIQASA